MMEKHPKINKFGDHYADDVELNQIDEKVIDIDEVQGLDYPLLEKISNGIFWPEAPKGRLDLLDTYEISSVPEDPDTPMESVDFLEDKGIMPK